MRGLYILLILPCLSVAFCPVGNAPLASKPRSALHAEEASSEEAKGEMVEAPKAVPEPPKAAKVGEYKGDYDVFSEYVGNSDFRGKRWDFVSVIVVPSVAAAVFFLLCSALHTSIVVVFVAVVSAVAHRIMLQANDRSRHLLINKKPSCPRSRALQDPLNLAASYPPFVPWFRECELRHGRTAMIAVLGFIATDYLRLPGAMYSFESIPKTIDAHDALLKTGPMYQLLLWVGLWDILITAPAAKAMGEGFREPGDFGWRWFAPETKEKFDVKRDAELKNGRLAMIAVGGIATQSIVSGHGFPYI